MENIEGLEARLNNLRNRPRTPEETEEMLKLLKLIEIERSKEFGDLFSQLNALGLQANSIWDLVNMKDKYPNGVVELLLRYLPYNYYHRNKEGIVRALTVKEAKGKACGALISEYEKTPKEYDDLRWVIGNAIATTMTLKEADWIYSTVVDRSNGRSRGQLVLALGTIRSEKSESLLIHLLDDSDVAPQAIAGLGKLKSKKAKDKLIQMRNSNNSLIRLEASKALKRID